MANSSFYSRWEQIRKFTEQVQGQNLATIIDALKAENVTLARMSYYGGGDSGDYHFPVFTVTGKDGKTEDLEVREGYGGSSHKIDSSGEFKTDREVVLSLVHAGDYDAKTKTQGPPYIEKSTRSLTQAICDIMEQAAEARHSGWCNNEGGEGEIVINVPEERLEVSHGDYIMETVWDEYMIEADRSGDNNGV